MLVYSILFICIKFFLASTCGAQGNRETIDNGVWTESNRNIHNLLHGHISLFFTLPVNENRSFKTKSYSQAFTRVLGGQLHPQDRLPWMGLVALQAQDFTLTQESTCFAFRPLRYYMWANYSQFARLFSSSD